MKQAPFRVLVGATMPAALVEVGFITNPEEEKLLFSEAHQVRLTNAIIQGLGRFIAALRANPPSHSFTDRREGGLRGLQ